MIICDGFLVCPDEGNLGRCVAKCLVWPFCFPSRRTQADHSPNGPHFMEDFRSLQSAQGIYRLRHCNVCRCPMMDGL
jgi:hypothetical protein